MLHILLLILKILLFVILGLLGLALLLILVILFAPIKYNFSVVKNENIKADAKIKFLIIAIKVYFDKNENKMDIIPSVIGIKLKKFNKKATQIKDDIDISDNLNENITSKKENIISEDFSDESKACIEGIEEQEEIKIDEDIETKKDIEFDEDIETKKDIEHDEDIKIKKDIEHDEDIKKNRKSSEKREKKDFQSKLSVLERKIELLKKFWNYDCTVKTRKYLKKYIISVIKHISPRKIKGYVRYGFGDPCKTGQITGYLSILPCVYQDDFNLFPDFYNKVLECDVFAKGRIRIAYLVRIIFNLNIWRTFKLFKKLSNRFKTVK